MKTPGNKINSLKNNDTERARPKVEVASIENLKDIQSLNKMLFDEEFERYDQTINCDWPHSKEGKDFYRERILNENGCAFVLKSYDKVIGYLVGSLSEDEFYRNIDSFAELDDMFVLKEFRSSGHGSDLYEFFINWCKENNIKRIKILVTAKNTQAIHFYNKIFFSLYERKNIPTRR